MSFEQVVKVGGVDVSQYVDSWKCTIDKDSSKSFVEVAFTTDVFTLSPLTPSSTLVISKGETTGEENIIC